MLQLGVLLSLAFVMTGEARRSGQSAAVPLVLMVALWLFGGMVGGMVGSVMAARVMAQDEVTALTIGVMFMPLIGSTIGALMAFMAIGGGKSK